MQNEINSLSKSAINHATNRGDAKEASALGQMFGSWRNGHIGDCAMRNAALCELSK